MASFTWKRSTLTTLEGIYCLEAFPTSSGLKVVAASESHNGICKVIDFETRKEEIVWNGPGGTMNVSQLNQNGDILAIQNFYKGFQSKEAQLVCAQQDASGWKTRVLSVLPYVHRSGVVFVEGKPYIVASTLCESRESATDWSHPGKIQIAKMPDKGEQPSFETIQEGVTKNHGFWQGNFDGRFVTLICGSEGIFEVTAPTATGGAWSVDNLLKREISDCAALDIDADGEDELLTFEGFHGDIAAVNKRINGKWEIIFTCPMHFSHAIWAGTLLGKPTFAFGYRKEDGCLYLLQKSSHEKSGFALTLLDEGVAPSNVRGFSHNGHDYLLCAARDADAVLLYEFIATP